MMCPVSHKTGVSKYIRLSLLRDSESLPAIISKASQKMIKEQYKVRYPDASTVAKSARYKTYLLSPQRREDPGRHRDPPDLEVIKASSAQL
jgi:hypothetical protein